MVLSEVGVLVSRSQGVVPSLDLEMNLLVS